MGKAEYLEPESKSRRRGLKMCLAVSAVLLIIIATVIVTLSQTIFKPRDPGVSIHLVGLENFQLFSPNSTTEPLGLVITVVNPNYGSFEYINSIGYLNYRHTIIAEVPMESRSIPARSKINMTTSAGIMTQKMISVPKFWSDVDTGAFNLTSNATLPGKVNMLRIIKLKATVYISCDIYFNITAMNADNSICVSKLKL